MQILNAAPRAAFTTAQVTALLVAPDLSVDFGCELLDASLNLVSDISADVAGGTVHRDNYANVHGTLDLTISRALAWGRDRVRPFMLLSSATAGVTRCRFNLGVYLLMTRSESTRRCLRGGQVLGVAVASVVVSVCHGRDPCAGGSGGVRAYLDDVSPAARVCIRVA